MAFDDKSLKINSTMGKLNLSSLFTVLFTAEVGVFCLFSVFLKTRLAKITTHFTRQLKTINSFE